jgi:hypothetical protein
VKSIDYETMAQACVRYEFACQTSDKACSEAEQAAGAKKLAYIIWHESDCATLKLQSQTLRNLVCCTSDDCNGDSKVGGGAKNATTEGNQTVKNGAAHLTGGAVAVACSVLALIFA